MLMLFRDGAAQTFEVRSDMFWRNGVEFELPVIAPLEELPDCAFVGCTGVDNPDFPGEKLFGRKDRGRPCPGRPAPATSRPGRPRPPFHPRPEPAPYSVYRPPSLPGIMPVLTRVCRSSIQSPSASETR